ncbi:helix-hairpin-helix domain-containing protein [Endozoicomonas sp. NE40]|uniref:DNA ligase (NAD(+)) n=1 Tax=Endozoicomonas lisbonensis TaxID=3120522 RepID=A0ABV2SJX4_9GAMM
MHWKCWIFSRGRYFSHQRPGRESDTVNQLYTMGFDLPTQFTEPVKSLEEVIRKRDQLQKQADRLPFLLDGIVLKVNSQAQQLAMGSSNFIPNWMLAWKFPPDVAVTTVRNIEFKVGRTGNITPVVVFDPVEIREQTITRVSMGSLNNLQGKDIAIGDQISIALKGSATPTFNKVILRDSQRKRPVLPDSQQYSPFTCLSLIEGCKEQFIARIQWLSKRLDLPGLDEPVIHNLVNSGQLKTLADLLTLSREQLQEAGSTWEQSGYFRSAIELTGALPFEQQVRALGIPDIGKARSTKLGKAFSNWDQLLQAENKQLQAIADVGEATIQQLRRYLQRPENQALIKILRQLQSRQ